MIPFIKNAKIGRNNLPLPWDQEVLLPPQAGFVSARGRTGAD